MQSTRPSKKTCVSRKFKRMPYWAKISAVEKNTWHLYTKTNAKGGHGLTTKAWKNYSSYNIVCRTLGNRNAQHYSTRRLKRPKSNLISI